MAQAGFTPISLYYSTTAAAVPSSGNLVAGELALNTVDEKLYFKNSAGTVKLLASNATSSPVTSFQTSMSGLTPSTATTGAVTLAGTLGTSSGGTGLTSFTANGVVYASSSSALATGSALTWDGSLFTVTHVSGVDGRGIRLVNSSNSQTWETRIGIQSLENTAYAIKDITAGAVRLVIQASTGNVGIGIDQPSARLAINLQDATAYANTAPSQSNCTAAFLNTAGHTTGGTFVGYQLNISGNSQNRIGYIGGVSESTTNQGLSLVFGTNSIFGDRTEKMRITSAGDVGIGTTAPDIFANSFERNLGVFISGVGTTSAINVSGGAASRIQFGVGTTRYGLVYQDASNFMQIGTTTALPISFITNTTQRFMFGALGQFGIGATPSYGNAGEVLTSGGASAAPTWAAAGGGSQAFVAFGSTGGL
jgi:hypothetical protein